VVPFEFSGRDNSNPAQEQDRRWHDNRNQDGQHKMHKGSAPSPDPKLE